MGAGVISQSDTEFIVDWNPSKAAKDLLKKFRKNPVSLDSEKVMFLKEAKTELSDSNDYNWLRKKVG
jgi:hypothetical protein